MNPASRDYWFVGWDPDARQITVRHHELIADAFAEASCLVSVIAADATLTHWQLSNTAVPLLAHHGESLLGTLAADAPFPLAAEEAPRLRHPPHRPAPPPRTKGPRSRPLVGPSGATQDR
ncbi:hypothetical protein BKA00_006080 [Actinomadura coerulea]|uniref:Uncharacterized protein n=1 Tax=Actinomadura coerulea TaxID=46159 RepID=A0A7X0L1Y3_9ACTN|nr:hypothetical protein [Actinomadura coerulea]